MASTTACRNALRASFFFIISHVTAIPGLGDGLNYNFSASSTPQPFEIAVDPAFINVATLKASLYRPTRDLVDYGAWEDGATQQNMTTIRDYWLKDYNWYDVQADLNRRYNHFTTTVHAKANYTHPIGLHFVHHRSNRSDAIPILFLHGWPSTFLEWAELIEPLTNPPNYSVPAFHVVAPDLPGYGFSPAPEFPGLGQREMGQGFDDLMHQLNYSTYGLYTTDLGEGVGRWMMHDAPNSILSRMSDFFFVTPNATDRALYAANLTTPEETAFIADFDYDFSMDFGYGDLHSTRPLQPSIPLNDSPVGFVGYMWQLLHMFSDGYPYSPQQLITDALVLFIPGVYGGIRFYKESFSGNGAGGLNDTKFPSSNIPTAITQWPSVIPGNVVPFSLAPVSWIQRTANVTFYNNNHNFGGHFPAVAQPEGLLNDIWSFYGNPSISGLERLRK